VFPRHCGNDFLSEGGKLYELSRSTLDASRSSRSEDLSHVLDNIVGLDVEIDD
jgi:hypothetical protein